MDNQTLIYLTDTDAEKFILFQKYYKQFSLLVDKKVFEQRGAVINIHFDKQSEIVNINRSDLLYQKGVNFENTN